MSESRPILSVAISPTNSGDHDGLRQALRDLADQDPSISIQTEPQTIIRGMDESGLERVCDRILREYKIEIDVSEPKVIYLETIRNRAEAEGKYIRQTGGHGNYGHVKILLEPNEPGKGFEFTDAIKGGVVPKEYIKPTEQGIRAASLNGVLAGYEMVDFKATLYDGSYHDQDSREMAFTTAGSMAFKEAAQKASPVLLEPVMVVEITVPDEHAAAIVRDIQSRRGRATGRGHLAGSSLVCAIVPLAEMLGYARHLRAKSGVPVECSMRFLHYAEITFSDEAGSDEAGVTANRPRGPKPKHRSAAADPEPEPGAEQSWPWNREPPSSNLRFQIKFPANGSASSSTTHGSGHAKQSPGRQVPLDRGHPRAGRPARRPSPRRFPESFPLDGLREIHR
jgi:translation elongation factor EF-G